MDTIRAIIFDLDGVICFTDNYHYQAWKELADAEGIYFDEKINGRLRGVSRMESLISFWSEHQDAIHRKKKNSLLQERMKLRSSIGKDVSKGSFG